MDHAEGQAGGVTPGVTPPGSTATPHSLPEAVRLAKEELGEASAQEVAAHVHAAFGIEIQPAVVTVLLGSLREREPPGPSL